MRNPVPTVDNNYPFFLLGNVQTGLYVSMPRDALPGDMYQIRLHFDGSDRDFYVRFDGQRVLEVTESAFSARRWQHKGFVFLMRLAIVLVLIYLIKYQGIL